MITAALFNVVIGMIIIYQWFVSLSKDKVPEMETSPKSILTHTIAEMITAIMLIMSGILLLEDKRKGYILYLFSTGMLIYTVINSAGYFWDQKNYYAVVMFGIILIAAISLFIVNM